MIESGNALVFVLCPKPGQNSNKNVPRSPTRYSFDMQPTLEQLRDKYGVRYKWLVLLTVMIGTIASILSSTIVNVAVPDLSHDFTLGQERAQWVSAGFMLAMTLS